MNSIACYILRSHVGQAVAGVRMLAPGLDLSWTAPALPGSPAGAPGESAQVPGFSPVETARQAAAFIVENLQALGTRSLPTLCIDPEGAICTWLSAPSPAPKVIAATIAQSAMPAVDPATGMSVAGGGAGRLALLSGADASTAFSELSIQALALDEDPARQPDHARAARYALVSIPDASVRVLIDELDRQNIEIGAVVSLWHAMASGLDPAVRAAARSLERDAVVAGSEIPSALLLVDPLGRLVWAWSLSGKLIVGGSMRLKRIAVKVEAPAPDAGPFADEPALQPDAGAARRIGAPAAPGRAPDAPRETYEEHWECSQADVGRLTLDWLAWSAQLGRSPQRVVCIGPAVVFSAAPDGPQSLAEALARAWPGATIDLVEEPDPIQVVLSRQDAAAAFAAAPAEKTRADAALPDPRAALTALSTRPSRATRRMFLWRAAGILALAALFIAAGYQLHRSADRAQDAIAAIRAQQAESLQSISQTVVNIDKSSDPFKDLSERLVDIRKRAAAAKPLPPAVPEVARVLSAFGQVRDRLPESARPELKIVEMTFTPARCSVRMQVPDAATGPDIEVALQSVPGAIRWTGLTPSASSGPRPFVLNGQWLETGAKP